MKDENKTKKELVKELTGLRRDMAELKRSQAVESPLEDRPLERIKRLKRVAELSMNIAGDPMAVFEQISHIIGELMDVPVVCLSEIRGTELYFLSVYVEGKVMTDAGHCPLDITPCATVEQTKDIRIYDKVFEKFPEASFLKAYNAYSYCGFPSLDGSGNVVAVTCLLDSKPHDFSDEDKYLLDILGQRIGFELERKKHLIKSKRAEEALKESEGRLQAIMDNSQAAIYVKDLEGRHIMVNNWFDSHFGIRKEEIIGKTNREIFPKEIADAMNANDLMVIEGKSHMEFEETVPFEDGQRTYFSIKFPLVDAAGKPYAVCGISTDITDRRRYEEENLKTQKLESLGILAGGIAHDFNNLLTGITGNLSLCKLSTNREDRNYKRLTELEKATFRARELTQQLLTFSKGGKPIKEAISIGNLLEESAVFALRGSNVRCDFFVPSDLWPVEADAGQMTQAVSNLVINADQAMPKGGMVKAMAENITLGAKDNLPLKKGRYVKVSIEDQGVGIPEEHLQKVFDPYFTTKQKGSGLGLSSVYSIIKKHEGHIEVTSRLGAGTTFNIFLPATSKEVPKKAYEAEVLIKGSGKILVMDDEEIVRDVVGEMLSNLGYEVDYAVEGNEAVGLYRLRKESGEPFDAVIMDLTIAGGLGGKEAIKKLLDIDPGAKVIVSSGYSNDPIMSDYKNYGFSGVIAKPYKVAELSAKVHKVIAGED